MNVRRATVEDWESSRDMRLCALTEDPDAFCSALEHELVLGEKEWRDRLDRAATFLAWQGDRTCGTITGKVDPHEKGGREIVALWVAPAARRSRVARALVDAVVDWARGEGAFAIALWVARDNHGAIRLYEGCGFTATGEQEPMRPGVDQFRMRKRLVE